jgi:S1-C subfamily serine protease
MTHDLMANLVTKLGAEVSALVIHDLIDDTYYALLELKKPDGETVLVDTRPSDGMALALRRGAPIRVSAEILAKSPDFEFLAPEGSEQVARAFGLTVVAPTPELRERFSLPERPGLVVTRAVGEAAARGLMRGDLLLEIAGVAPTDPVEFLEAVEAAPLDRPLPVTYWRDGEERTTELSPAEREERGEGPRRVA